MSKALLHTVQTVLGFDCLESSIYKGEVEILVSRDQIAMLLEKLRDDDRTTMNQLVDLCGVDYLCKVKRFEVVYNLLSLKHNMRLRVRVVVDKEETVPTVTGVYTSAGWFERECFDLFGIIFDGHPDLRRILTDYGFEGYPLRRDFPLSGHTQVRYNDLEQRVVKEPVQLEETNRDYDALSPWKGVTDVQKRGKE